jgi:hypothetical protein
MSALTAFATGFFGQASANMQYNREVEDQFAEKYAGRFQQGMQMYTKAKAARQKELDQIKLMTNRTGDPDLATYIVKQGIKDENVIDRLAVDKINRKPIEGLPVQQTNGMMESAKPSQGTDPRSLYQDGQVDNTQKYVNSINNQSSPSQPQASQVPQGYQASQVPQGYQASQVPQTSQVPQAQQQETTQGSFQGQQQPQRRTFGAMLGLTRDPQTGAMVKAARSMGVDPALMQAVSSGNFESQLPQLPEVNPNVSITLRPKADDEAEKLRNQVKAIGLDPDSPEGKKAISRKLGFEDKTAEKQFDDEMTAVGAPPGSAMYKKAIMIKAGLAPRAVSTPEPRDLLAEHLKQAGYKPGTEDWQQAMKNALPGHESNHKDPLIEHLKEAGYTPGTDEWKQAMKDAIPGQPDSVKFDDEGYVVNNKVTSSLRKEIQNNPITKRYQAVAPMYDSTKRAVKEKTRAADLSMIYAFAKVMDPDSSVREGEQQLVLNAGTFGDYLQSMYSKVAHGESQLTDETRKQLIDQVEIRVGALHNEYENTVENYKGIAQRQHLNPKDVFIYTDKDRTPGGSTPSSEQTKQSVAPMVSAPKVSAEEFVKMSDEDKNKHLESMSPDELNKLADELDKEGKK